MLFLQRDALYTYGATGVPCTAATCLLQRSVCFCILFHFIRFSLLLRLPAYILDINNSQMSRTDTYFNGMRNKHE